LPDADQSRREPIFGSDDCLGGLTRHVIRRAGGERGIVGLGTYHRDILSVPTQKFLFTLVLDRGTGQKRSMEERMAVGGFGPAEGLGLGIAASMQAAIAA
jgi:hypothetical protein